MITRHRLTFLEHGREVCRLERRIDELERALDQEHRAHERAEHRADRQEQRYHRAARDLRALENRMERRKAALRDFLGRVSHEASTNQE